ncbi:MAG TPA: ATP-grasp domain-containing protein, partial [Pirellulaceae bacterium]|nr:ATP-grasp domain-containing protein [Pirellulaceae bacterium]
MTTAVTTLHQTERELTTTTQTQSHSPILPGSTIGVLGGGQLGRMLALAAKRMGYRVHVLSPERDSPARQVADLAIEAEYDNVEVVERFARNVDVVTFEFENVPLAAAEAAARHAPVRPGGGVLHTTQNRVREKAFLRDSGVPHARVETVESLDQLRAALGRIGVPAVLKSADWGYDGKGQFKFTNAGQAGEAWKAIDER